MPCCFHDCSKLATKQNKQTNKQTNSCADAMRPDLVFSGPGGGERNQQRWSDRIFQFCCYTIHWDISQGLCSVLIESQSWLYNLYTYLKHESVRFMAPLVGSRILWRGLRICEQQRHNKLGRSGGMLPQENFKIWNVRDAIYWAFRVNLRQKIHSPSHIRLGRCSTNRIPPWLTVSPCFRLGSTLKSVFSWWWGRYNEFSHRC